MRFRMCYSGGMGRAKKERRQAIAKALAKFHAKQSHPMASRDKSGPLSRSSVEAYGFGTVAIVLAVVDMTWWLRSSLLCLLGAVAVDAVRRSSLSIHWQRSTKTLVSVILFCVIWGVGISPVLEDYYDLSINPPELPVIESRVAHDDQVTVSNNHNKAQYDKWLRVKPTNDNLEFNISIVGDLDTETSSIGETTMGLSDGSKLLWIRRMAAHGSRVFRITSHLKTPAPTGLIEFTIDHKLIKETRGISQVKP